MPSPNIPSYNVMLLSVSRDFDADPSCATPRFTNTTRALPSSLLCDAQSTYELYVFDTKCLRQFPVFFWYAKKPPSVLYLQQTMYTCISILLYMIPDGCR